MNSFLQDMRYAMRQLRRDPSFTAVVLLILALGIGANARTFSVAHDALLKPLPWDERNPEKERTKLVRNVEASSDARCTRGLQIRVGTGAFWLAPG
jgi:hypothetical protein